MSRLFLSALVFVISFSSNAWAAQLNYGKYFGFLQMDGQKQKIAVSLDAFLTQVGDPTVFPQVDIIIRVNLGGYFSSEYVAYRFYDPTFNFEKGILQLDDRQNELTATLQVKNTGSQTILEGPVTYRPTNTHGTIQLTMQLEPDDGDGPGNQPAHDETGILSALRGEYRGQCGGRAAAFQIETGRGIEEALPGNALAGYSITGRVGYSNGKPCDELDPANTAAEYCNQYSFSKGAYYLYNGKLTMQGALATIDCERDGDGLSCSLHKPGADESCRLSKKPVAPTKPVQIPASVFLDVPSVQMKPLPDPLPPGNEDLIAALHGDYYGFLHYENRDIYQLMQMNLVATTSTENPHVQNQVLVAPTISLSLASSWDSSSRVSTRFSERVFYLNPGFAFSSDDEDGFAVIGDWRSGYVSGVWYSRAYGRVGTFELIKGVKPSVQRGMGIVPGVAGQFQGPKDSSSRDLNLWWLQISAPGQEAHGNQSTMNLLGQYRLRGGLSPVRAFDQGALDFNTGSLSFLVRNPGGDRLVTGSLVSDQNISLLWPVGPGLGAPMSNYSGFSYARTSGVE